MARHSKDTQETEKDGEMNEKREETESLRVGREEEGEGEGEEADAEAGNGGEVEVGPIVNCCVLGRESGVL